MGKRKIPKHNKIDPSVTDDHTKHLNSYLQLPGVQEQVAPQLQLGLPQCSIIVALLQE
jgi:hypothetical protein